jgi:hypothetical protein
MRAFSGCLARSVNQIPSGPACSADGLARRSQGRIPHCCTGLNSVDDVTTIVKTNILDVALQP